MYAYVRYPCNKNATAGGVQFETRPYITSFERWDCIDYAACTLPHGFLHRAVTQLWSEGLSGFNS
eukprot:2857594-Amphidinium_carterae.1